MEIRHCARAFAAPVLAVLVGSISPAVQAIEFSLPWNDNSIEGVLNTTITVGAQWRMQNRSSDLVGKANLNPNLCGRGADGLPLYQSCQGLFRTQTYTAERLASAPGQFSMNNDDGNLNYDKGDITQAPLKVTQDLTLSYGDFGFFAKTLYFYDFVNNDFEEFHPNRITSENLQQVGNVSDLTTDTVIRTDSTPCPSNRGAPGPCGIVYGAGGVVRNQRTDGETLRQIGTDLQILDAYFYGRLPLPFEKELTFKIGRQTVNWGESTLLVFDSINQANPVNANNFFRVGFQVEEVFTPLGMLFLSTEPFENTTLEGFYQYEWKPLEAPAPGSYFSFVDLGSYDAVNNFNISFGGAAEDPEAVGRLLDNPLSGLTNTTSTGLRLPDNNPSDGGQFGLSLRYYAEWLNNGTEIAAYYMNYHSRTPLVSVYSVPDSCAKNTVSTVEFLANCDDIPLLHMLTNPNSPATATSSAVNFDDLRIQFEYPEDIQLFGLSFNTTVGDISLQGEVAYRPKAPLQVDLQDLVFGAFGPTLSNCHIAPGCAGTGAGIGNVITLFPQVLQDAANDVVAGVGGPVGGIGTDETGQTIVYPGSRYVIDAAGTPGDFDDTYDLLVGHMTGSARAFPSFIIPYRGMTIGTNPENSYIRGWEEMETYQFNLGGTYVLGATDALPAALGADQIIALFETGATWVPGLPSLDVLQFEAAGTDLHASAGADGTGADRSRQACSTNPTCSFGADGLRFNPSQENLDLYPDKLSWGYVIIALIRYESVFPGISFQPQIIWKHDVNGTAPGIATNFVEGRKQADIQIETRYKSALSFNLGYSWFTGGGGAHLIRDRDAARVFLKYQF